MLTLTALINTNNSQLQWKNLQGVFNDPFIRRYLHCTCVIVLVNTHHARPGANDSRRCIVENCQKPWLLCSTDSSREIKCSTNDLLSGRSDRGLERPVASCPRCTLTCCCRLCHSTAVPPRSTLHLCLICNPYVSTEGGWAVCWTVMFSYLNIRRPLSRVRSTAAVGRNTGLLSILWMQSKF